MEADERVGQLMDQLKDGVPIQNLVIVNKFYETEKDKYISANDNSHPLGDVMTTALLMSMCGSARLIEQNQPLSIGSIEFNELPIEDQIAYQILPNDSPDEIQITTDISFASSKRVNFEKSKPVFIHASMLYTDNWRHLLRVELEKDELVDLKYVIVSLVRKNGYEDITIISSNPIYSEMIEDKSVRSSIEISANTANRCLTNMFYYANNLAKGRPLYYIEEFKHDEEYVVDTRMPLSVFTEHTSIFPQKTKYLHTNKKSLAFVVEVVSEKIVLESL